MRTVIRPSIGEGPLGTRRRLGELSFVSATMFAASSTTVATLGSVLAGVVPRIPRALLLAVPN